MQRLLFTLSLALIVGNLFAQPAVYIDKTKIAINPAAPQRIPMTIDSSIVSWNYHTTTKDTIIFVVGNKAIFMSKPGVDSGSGVIKKPVDTTVKSTDLTVYLKKTTDTGFGIKQAQVTFTWGSKVEPATQKSPIDTTKKPIPLTLSQLYSNYYHDHVKKFVNKTNVGLKSNNDNYAINIYFDEFGNSLYGSLPTGISQRYYYIVHIVHPNKLSGVDDFIYSVNQTAGSLSDVPVYYNGNVSLNANSTTIQKQAGDIKDTLYLTETKNVLYPSSTNLSFDLTVTTITAGTATPKKLNSYTITMTPLYFGSFDVGVIISNLNNPSYTLVNDPNATGQTVKVTDNGKNTFISVLYTVYWSPINALFPKSSKDENIKFNAFGRSYLDDNKSFLRNIYPCIGVSLNDQLLTNWFAGLNFEPAQGLGIFAGWNIRKINTFDMPNFVPGQTVVTQDQYNYYTNTKLKTQFAFGVEVDISAFIKILGNLSTTH